MPSFPSCSNTYHNAPARGLFSCVDNGLRSRSGGFTLLELVAVIAILAGLMAIVLPRFAMLGTAMLRSDSGRLTSLIRYTSDASATRRLEFMLSFDMDSNRVVVEEHDEETDEYLASSDPAMRPLSFSRGVEIKDVITPASGRVDYGIVRVEFGPERAPEPFTVHLGTDGEARTITYNPYSGRVKVADGYL